MDTPLSNGGTVTPIIALAGSAGTFRALQEFFRVMPADNGAAFVVVTHLDPKHTSSLPEVIRRWTPMRAVHARNRQKVEPNCIYVIPSGKFLYLDHSGLRLSAFRAQFGARKAIDLFLSSLAEARGRSAAAVLFSGADSDGAAGMVQIKDAGGLTIVQKPEEATHPFMPETAIATGKISFILPTAEIPAKLLEHFPHRGNGTAPRPPSLEELEQTVKEDVPALRQILATLREQTGHDFTHYRQPGLLRRLSRRMQYSGVETLPDYHDVLRSQSNEAGALVHDFLISLTSFFRDTAAFQALEREVPDLFEGKGPKDPVRVWVPGCATGEEVFSIAMLLREHAQTLASPPPIQIFGTDVDATAIQFARAGIYPEPIAKPVGPERLERFFTRESRGYRVRRELREMVLFSRHDILTDAPFAQIDLISCRNLLIYLGTEPQKRVLDILHFALRPEKLLFLGPAEMVEGKSNLFDAVSKKHRIYRRRPGPRSAPTILNSDALQRTLGLQKEISRPVLSARSFAGPASAKGRPAKATGRQNGDHVSQLRADLEQSIKDHQATIAELLANNQELQAINAELRTTTDELDVSRQEMQSVNEELSAVNQELSMNLEDLSRANSDLQNFMNATAIPTVFLDRDLSIMRYTPGAVGLFRLIGSDLGRPLSDLNHRLDYAEMMSDAQQILAGEPPIEREVRESGGPRWFLSRVLPYRAPEEQIAGVVLTFVDITERKRAEAALEEQLGTMTGLHNLADRLLTVMDLPIALGEVLDAAIRLFKADRGTVQIHDAQADVLRYAASRGFDEKMLGSVPPIDRDFHSTCAVAIRTGQRVVAADIASDPQWAAHASTAAMLDYAAAISAPMKTRREDLQGVITVHFRQPRVPTDRDLRYLDLYARLGAHLVERGRAEKALRDSEEKYRTLFETIDEGFCRIEMIFDSGGRPIDLIVRDVNSAYEKESGLAAADVIGRLNSEYAPNLEREWLEFYGNIVRTGQPGRMEYHAAPHGKWLNVYAQQVGGPGSRQLVVAFNDVTDRKRTEIALRESEAKLARELEDAKQLQAISRLFFEQENIQPICGAIVDAAAALLRSDAASLQMFDPEKKELRLLAWRGFHPESAAYWQRVSADTTSGCGAALERGQRMVVVDVNDPASGITSGNLQAYRRSGITAVQSTPVTARDGRLLGVISTHWRAAHTPSEKALRLLEVLARQAADFFERRRTQEALQQSERRLQRMLETEAFGMIFFDLTGTVIHANEAFLKMTGYTADDVARRTLTWRTMTPPEFVAVSEAQLEKLAATGKIGPYEKEYLCKDGTRRWMRFAGRDLGDGTIGELCIDITAEARASSPARQG